MVLFHPTWENQDSNVIEKWCAVSAGLNLQERAAETDTEELNNLYHFFVQQQHLGTTLLTLVL